MSQFSRLWFLVAFSTACSSSPESDEPEPAGNAGIAGIAGGPEASESLPLGGGGAGSGGASGTAAAGSGAAEDPPASEPATQPDPALVRFVDPATGLETHEVHDANRDIVHFDRERGAMVWAASGDTVSGWTTTGVDLDWDRSGVAFRVRFGTENGERRAYFTETDAGTICDLDIRAEDVLSIRATSQRPPEE